MGPFKDSLITEDKRLQRGILGESKQQSSLSNKHLSEFAGDSSSSEQTRHSPAGTLGVPVLVGLRELRTLSA